MQLPATKDLDEIDWDAHSFIDLGASSGGSLGACEGRFDAPGGVGVDIDSSKVQKSRAAGHNVIQADARALRVSKAVRFVSALDFLEHLPSLADVEAVIDAAARAATDFVYISHPSFEGEHYLNTLGSCQYWHRWRGHPTHITISDFCSIFARLGLHAYSIAYIDRISSSDHYSILPLSAPRDQGPYKAELHGPKPTLTLDEPVWRTQKIIVALRTFSSEEWNQLLTKANRP